MTTLRDHPLVVFADDWGRHPSSAQHLVSRLPRAWPTLWVQTVGTRRPALSWSDLRRAGEILRRRGGEGIEVPSDLRILRPRMSPFAPTGWTRRWNHRAMRNTIRAALAAEALPAPIVLTTLPLTADLVGDLGEALHVYYCVDDYASWPGGFGEPLRERERDLLAGVDGVVATSRALWETRQPRSGRRLYLPHGVDDTRFRPGLPEHPALRTLSRPRVGYVGLLDDRHDHDLWARLVAALPDVSFAVVGPRQVEPAWLDAPHVTVVDAVPYEEVPSVLGGLDVAVLPYRVDGAGASINPLKGKEILAAGVPLVASPLPELTTWPDVARLAGPGDFVDAVRSALAEASDPDPGRAQRVRQFVAGESWDGKARELAACLDGWLEETVAHG